MNLVNHGPYSVASVNHAHNSSRMRQIQMKFGQCKLIGSLFQWTIGFIENLGTYSGVLVIHPPMVEGQHQKSVILRVSEVSAFSECFLRCEICRIHEIMGMCVCVCVCVIVCVGGCVRA